MAPVITFGIGYVVTRSTNDSNNFEFWKIGILENGWVGLDDIIVHNSHELKINDSRHQLGSSLTNVFPSLFISVSTSIIFPKHKFKASYTRGLLGGTIKWVGGTLKYTLHGSNTAKIRPI